MSCKLYTVTHAVEDDTDYFKLKRSVTGESNRSSTQFLYSLFILKKLIWMEQLPVCFFRFEQEVRGSAQIIPLVVLYRCSYLARTLPHVCTLNRGQAPYPWSLKQKHVHMISNPHTLLLHVLSLSLHLLPKCMHLKIHSPTINLCNLVVPSLWLRPMHGSVLYLSRSHTVVCSLL